MGLRSEDWAGHAISLTLLTQTNLLANLLVTSGHYLVGISILDVYSTLASFLSKCRHRRTLSIIPLIGCIWPTPLYEKLPHTNSSAPPCFTVFYIYRALYSVLGGCLTHCLDQVPSNKTILLSSVHSMFPYFTFDQLICSWANFKGHTHNMSGVRS